MIKGIYHTKEELIKSFSYTEIKRFKQLNIDYYTVVWKETERSKLIKWIVLSILFNVNLLAAFVGILINPACPIWFFNIFVIFHLIESDFITLYENLHSTYEAWPKRLT